ncbi:FmdE family protein [Desulfospira joergensenii]|uniref:FmdE family protein n=1 Tax=Desulfospira joergensenii TaxID=53329 RepID=UPI0003B397E1|nr:FmdE family protein [Desulfospira joergensenii]
MACSIEKELIEQTIAFHGHNCPGLSIGIRASELAMEKLDIHESKSALCVTETDMCGVDAIQFLTGCSFGKGNLVHRDWGKSAFTFYDRDVGKGFRALFRDDFRESEKDAELTRDLMARALKGRATGEEQTLVRERRSQRIHQIMNADLDALFVSKEIDAPPVRPARILKSIPCDTCGEMTMETRIRLFDGTRMCIPCFQGVEQKI